MFKIHLTQPVQTLAPQPRPTYRADIGVVAGGAGYAAEILGSPNRAVRIHRVFFSKPSVQVTLSLIKASSPSTGGTSTNATPVPLDTQSPGAEATVKLFTAAPTAGRAVGNLFVGVIAATDVLWEDFGDIGQGAVVLHGPSQALGINVSGAATIVGYVEWSEE